MSTKPKKVKLPNRTVIHTLDVSPKGDQLIIGQDSGKSKSNLTLWSLPDLRPISELPHEEYELMLMARFLADGEMVAYVDSKHKPMLYSLAEKKASAIKLKNPRVQWIWPSLKDQRLVFAGAVTQVWDASTGKVVWSLPGQVASKDPDSVPAVAALDPNGKHVAVAGAERGCIQIYDLDVDEPVQRLTGAPDQARWVSYDPSGHYFAAIESDSHGIFLWDVQTGEQLLPDVFGPEFESYWCLRFASDGEHIALGMLSGYVGIIRLEDGKFILDEQEHKGRVWDLAFTPDGKQMVSGGDDATLCLWNLG